MQEKVWKRWKPVHSMANSAQINPPKQSFLHRFLGPNLLLKGISVALALVFWAWVKAEEVVEVKGRVKVEYLYPMGFVPVEQGPRYVTVTLSGARGKVSTVEWNRMGINIDASDAVEGPLDIDFSDRALEGVTKSLKVERISPPAVELQLDIVATRSSIVKPSIVGEPAFGYEMAKPIITPKTLEISGPQSLVQTMVEFDTDIVDIEGAELDLDVVVDIVIEQRTVTAETRKARVQIPIRPIIDRQVLSDIPIQLSEPNWSTLETNVTVEWEGPVLELAALKTQPVSVLITPPETPPGNGFVTLQYRDNVIPGSYTLIPDLSTKDLAVVRESLPNIQIRWTSPAATDETENELEATKDSEAAELNTGNFELPTPSENDTTDKTSQAEP